MSLTEREHGSLASRDDDGVELRDIDVSRLASVFDKRYQLWCRDEPHADEVARRVAARITRIAQRVRLAFASVRAEYLNVVSFFSEAQIRMREFTPPETDRPAGRRGDRGIGDHDCHTFWRLTIDDVRILQTHDQLLSATIHPISDGKDAKV